jgi:hypothetical protein
VVDTTLAVAHSFSLKLTIRLIKYDYHQLNLLYCINLQNIRADHYTVGTLILAPPSQALRSAFNPLQLRP